MATKGSEENNKSNKSNKSALARYRENVRLRRPEMFSEERLKELSGISENGLRAFVVAKPAESIKCTLQMEDVETGMHISRGKSIHDAIQRLRQEQPVIPGTVFADEIENSEESDENVCLLNSMPQDHTVQKKACSDSHDDVEEIDMDAKETFGGRMNGPSRLPAVQFDNFFGDIESEGEGDFAFGDGYFPTTF